MTGCDSNRRSKTSQELHSSGGCFMSESSAAPVLHRKLCYLHWLNVLRQGTLRMAHASNKHFSSFTASTSRIRGICWRSPLFFGFLERGTASLEWAFGFQRGKMPDNTMPERSDSLNSWIRVRASTTQLGQLLRLTMLPVTCACSGILG